MSASYLLVDVLQQWSPLALHLLLLLLLVLAVVLQRVCVPEVCLCVDVVEARPRHQQLALHQLHVLQEGQTFLALPPPDLLALNAVAGRH